VTATSDREESRTSTGVATGTATSKAGTGGGSKKVTPQTDLLKAGTAN